MTTPVSLQPGHNSFSSLSNTTAVAIFLNVCLWRRSLCSNLGGIGPEKLYRATLITLIKIAVDIHIDKSA